MKTHYIQMCGTKHILKELVLTSHGAAFTQQRKQELRLRREHRQQKNGGTTAAAAKQSPGGREGFACNV